MKRILEELGTGREESENKRIKLDVEEPDNKRIKLAELGTAIEESDNKIVRIQDDIQNKNSKIIDTLDPLQTLLPEEKRVALDQAA